MLFDTGAMNTQIEKINGDSVNKGEAKDQQDMEAAQEAANQADAILDSLQMPRLTAPVPTAVTVVHPSSASSSSESSRDDKGEIESDDGSMDDGNKQESGNMRVTRRTQRRMEHVAE